VRSALPRPVVEVALDPALGLVTGSDDPRARGDQLVCQQRQPAAGLGVCSEESARPVALGSPPPPRSVALNRPGALAVRAHLGAPDRVARRRVGHRRPREHERGHRRRRPSRAHRRLTARGYAYPMAAPASPSLSASQLATLAGLGEERTAAVGDMLFRAGDATYPFTAIREGEVAILESRTRARSRPVRGMRESVVASISDVSAEMAVLHTPGGRWRRLRRRSTRPGARSRSASGP
jgi:hypothetical protein